MNKNKKAAEKAAETEAEKEEQRKEKREAEAEKDEELETDILENVGGMSDGAAQFTAELEKLKDQLLRQAAEFDNYRKRTVRERAELTPDITAKVLTKFLPVIDSVERAMSAECSDTEYKKGVDMIGESFGGLLAELGVSEIDTGGQFDPNFHQAVQQIDVSEAGDAEGAESGKIAQVFQKGYKLGDKVLKFAMVTVYK